MKSQICGFGLGLRVDHYRDFVERMPSVDWLEIVTENYMVPGGKPLHYLDAIRRNYPMVMHGVSLSVASADPIDDRYLKDLKTLAERVEPAWISDHLCWTGVDRLNVHDLLPVPYTEEAIRHVADRVSCVQDFLGRQILLENVSTYVAYKASEMSEWEFISEVARRSDCLLLLDVNNVYVSSVNHGFDPRRYIDALPATRIRQIHLAGHEDHGDHIIDTHDHDICDAVWSLYDYTIERFGSVPAMIERDDNIPPLDALLAELAKARAIASRASRAEPYELVA